MTAKKTSTNKKTVAKNKIHLNVASEEPIDTRVKIHGQPLKLKETTPSKLDGVDNKTAEVSTIKTHQVTNELVKNNIVEKVKQESKKPTKVKVRDEDNYSPAILSDAINSYSESRSSIILAVILTAIAIILVGFIISWYYKQYGDSSISQSATKVLSASEENSDPLTIPIGNGATKSQVDIETTLNNKISPAKTETSQKLDEMKIIARDLDQDDLTPEPKIELNIEE